jgi:hypothetical protein
MVRHLVQAVHWRTRSTIAALIHPAQGPLLPDFNEIQFETFNNPPALGDSGMPIARAENPVPATTRKKRREAVDGRNPRRASWEFS